MKSINNTQEFKALIKTDKPILLDFYADWCGPCQVLLPKVEKLSEKYKDDFVVAKINVDQNQELARHFSVRSIPALFFIKDGKITERLAGVQPEFVLETKMKDHLVEV